jgi:hypothetical protein
MKRQFKWIIAMTLSMTSMGLTQEAGTVSHEPALLGAPITDRTYWDALVKRKSFKDHLTHARKEVETPMPKTTDELYLQFSKMGNRTNWQAVASQRRSRITRFVLAECLENKGTFLPAIEETIKELCKETTWVMPAHDRGLDNFKGKQIDIDLGSSGLSWQMALTYSLLGDRLKPKTRELLKDNLYRRTLNPFKDMVDGKRKRNWWMDTTNNWNAVCLAGVLGTAVAVSNDSAERKFFMDAAVTYSKNFLKGFTSDGYCTEGLAYWNYGFGNYLYLAELVRLTSKGAVDLWADEKVQLIARFGERIQIQNDIYPAFADCGVTSKPNSKLMTFVMVKYGFDWSAYKHARIIRPSGSLSDTLIYSQPKIRPVTKELSAKKESPLRTWFDKAGILISRPGVESSSKLAVAMKGGHNAEHHNHNDVGSYVIVLDNELLVADPGGEVYTSRTFSSKRYDSNLLNSWGHSVPVVAGQLQRTGKNSKGVVTEQTFTDTKDRVTFDVKSAYRQKDLKSLTRTFEYSRQEKGGLSVTDHVSFANPQTFETAMITFETIEKKTDSTFLIKGKKNALLLEIDTGGIPFTTKIDTIEEDIKHPKLPKRLGIRLSKPTSKATVILRYTDQSH